jgi:hypothetical protein
MGTHRITGVTAAVLATWLAGCSGGGGQMVGKAADAITYYKDIKPLVEQKCQGCHYPGGIGPFALQSYQDIMVHKPAITVAVANRVMPPWLAKPGCTPYQDDRSLTDAQRSTFMTWLGKSVPPAGDAAQYQAPAAGRTRALSRVDMHLAPLVAYTPTLRPDDYRCFLLDLPGSAGDKFVTGFRANPAQPAIVHHVIAYLIPPKRVPTEQAKDGADGAPGYTCFSAPGGGLAEWLGSWAPGGLGSDYPAGTGLKMPAGSKIALQVHYNTLATDPVPDQSSIDFKVDAAVDRPGYVGLWLDPSWIRNQSMNIPAGAPDTVHSFKADPSSFISILTGGAIDGTKGLDIFSAGLHMHTRGTKAEIEIDHASGDTDCMLDIPAWNFHWQNSYAFTQPKVFMPGDQISMTCHWDNSAANQPMVNGVPMPPKDINWGEGTGDEMCLGIMYFTQHRAAP